MFTGLIEDLGKVRDIRRGSDCARLELTTGISAEEITLGESIAVNGICLTVVAFDVGWFAAEASPETLDRSNLGDLQAGSSVNLERALRMGDRLGGHLVSGHVDAVATITERKQDANAVRFGFRLPAAVNRYIVEKGSVAIDGISLTVNGVGREGFDVAVIPHTLEATTLKEKQVGARVNIETDLIGKYVERLLDRDGTKGSVNLEFLAKHGFL